MMNYVIGLRISRLIFFKENKFVVNKCANLAFSSGDPSKVCPFAHQPTISRKAQAAKKL